ncbi:MAG: hypothetical protein ABIG95_02950 [Candidatus Woesearchaeota archaeon]
MNGRKVLFAIAICLIYIPMVFMAVNTFFPKTPLNECYAKYRLGPMVAEKANASQMAAYNVQIAEYDAEMQACDMEYEQIRTKYDGWKFIVIMLVNIMASLVILTKLDKSVVYGLFFGVVVTAFVSSIRYGESRSIPGFALLVVLFGIVIYFVNSRKDS